MFLELSLPRVGVLVALPVIYWIGWVVYARTFHPLSRIPGPFLATVSRLWYMLKIWTEDVEKDERALHEKYGPLVRLAPDEISCSDPEAFADIYRFSNALDKAQFYEPYNTTGFSPHGDVFSCKSDKKHGQRRRITSSVYSMSNVSKSEQYIDTCSDLLTERLGQYADSGKPCDIGEWLHWYTFDIIGELFYGRAFGFVDEGKDQNDWIKSLDKMIPFVCLMGVAPPILRPFVGIGCMLTSAGKEIAKGVKNIGESSARLMKDAYESRLEAPRTDMAQQVFSIYEKSGEKFDYRWGDVEQESYGALFAGSDTTAIAFRSLFYHLMHNPEAYRKLEAEVDQAVNEGRLSMPPTYKETSQLPYLCACIKEALRIHPGAQLSLPRIVPPQGMTLCGQFIPGGYVVGINAAVLHFDKKVFGADAESFNPDRWMDQSRANYMDKFMMAFGGGTRTCLGKNIALIELHKLTPQLVWNYRFEFYDQAKTQWHTRNTFFARQEGVIARVKRRNH
ncbi:Cytochrome P450 monooxygenase gsfF [Colletotrichum gloeosporioides]|uniref:Cytochrome P450 monooxygenase gsfF n=1 Tax=Colletotrichum gloeosporioides TaxID=474922 RepID=A0A8H4FHY1_COLGL|nr:Cytochrome P450 monooxygenase gsfF [Colletotrichum gloeosporioides]KAF3802730.1 Cytochrome P450 monooxygenase gsfF [Colletotrichum gloeosporioides]